MTLMFGNTPVPWTVSWSGEESHYVGVCPHIGRRALMQAVAPGIGKPLFGKPHSQRQRQCIAEDRCDICGKSLKLHTKVSLSHARPVPHGANGWAILQVEPMVHRGCGADAVRWCPALKRDMAAGLLKVRQVTRHRCQFAVMGLQFIEHYVPGFKADPADMQGVIGHAKVELLRWKDRDEAWLQRSEAA